MVPKASNVLEEGRQTTEAQDYAAAPQTPAPIGADTRRSSISSSGANSNAARGDQLNLDSSVTSIHSDPSRRPRPQRLDYGTEYTSLAKELCTNTVTIIRIHSHRDRFL